MASTLGQLRELMRFKNRNSISERSEFILNRILRDALFTLNMEGEWDWMLRSKSLLFLPTYSTGTVLGTFNSAAVVGTGTGWTTSNVKVKESSLRMNGVNNSNVITALADTTHLTIEGINPSPTEADQTYEITHDRIILDTNFRALYSLNSPQLPSPLAPSSIEVIQYARFYAKETGWPRIYTLQSAENADGSVDNFLAVYPPTNEYLYVTMNYSIWPIQITEATPDATLLTMPPAAEFVYIQYCLSMLDDDQKGLPLGPRLDYLKSLTSQYLGAHRLKKQLPMKAYASIDIGNWINPLSGSMGAGEPANI